MIGEMGVLLPSLEVGDEGWEEDLVDGMRWEDWFWGWIAITGGSCVVFVGWPRPPAAAIAESTPDVLWGDVNKLFK